MIFVVRSLKVFKLTGICELKGGSPRLVVVGKGSCSRVVGSNPNTHLVTRNCLNYDSRVVINDQECL